MSQQSQPSTCDARLVRHSTSPNVADEDHRPMSGLPYRDCITHALHLALAYQHVPEELILTLLAGNRESAKERNSTGISASRDLPLHMAIESRYSDRVILALLAVYPEAARIETAHRGDLPLHQAIKQGYAETVVMEIFLAYPSAAMIRCKQTGMLPLHLAASSTATPTIVNALITEYPEALDIKVNNATPRDLVTSLLPVASMKMICRPSMYWLNILSTVAAEKADADRSTSTDSTTSTASSQAASGSASSCTSSGSVAHDEDDEERGERNKHDPHPPIAPDVEGAKKQSAPRIVTQDSLTPYLPKNINTHHYKKQKAVHTSSTSGATATHDNILSYDRTSSRESKTPRKDDKVSLPTNISEEEATTSTATKEKYNEEGEKEALDPELKPFTDVALTTDRMIDATTATNSSMKKDEDGDSKSEDSESTTTLSEGKSTTSEQRLVAKKRINDIQTSLKVKKDAYPASNQDAPLNFSLNLNNVLLHDYHSRSASAADPWQEIVARLEHHQGYHHLHHLHHEAAYLTSSSTAASHRLRDTNAAIATLDGSSSIRSLVRYPHLRDTQDFYANNNEMRSSIVTPLLRSFLQNDYDNHMDEVARESKRIYLAQNSDGADAERFSRDSGKASSATALNSSSTAHPTRSHPTKGNPSVRNKNRPLGVTAMGHMRHYVQHNYHDHSNDVPFSDEAVDVHMRGTNCKSPASSSAAMGYSDSSVAESAAAASQNHSQQQEQRSLSKDIQARRGRSPFGVTPMGRMQNVVRHNYHDHSEAVPLEREKDPSLLGESSIFPVKLHNLLENVEADGHEGFISWQPHGRAFKIHNRNKFVELVMPKHFRQSKFESFRRQLCLYGFLTITQGTDKGSLYHELFLRGRPFLAKKIKRQKLKGTIIRTVACPEAEPDFYSMPHVHKLD